MRILHVPSSSIQKWTDLDDERSVASWFSSMQFLIPALLLTPVLLDAFRRREPYRWALLALALLFVVLSADEAIEFHEWVGYESDILLPHDDRNLTVFHTTGVWMFVVGIPFLVVAGVLLRQAHAAFRRVPGVMTRLVVGGAIWLSGALGLESLSNFIGPDDVWLNITEVFFEETLEMFGVTVMVWSMYQLLVGLGFRWELGRAGARDAVLEVDAAPAEVGGEVEAAIDTAAR